MTNSFDRHPYLKSSNCEPARTNTTSAAGQVVNQLPNNMQHLSDYIKHVVAAEASPKKLTFDEWWLYVKQQYSLDDCDSLYTSFRACWAAAQENA